MSIVAGAKRLEKSSEKVTEVVKPVEAERKTEATEPKTKAGNKKRIKKG